MPDIRNQDVNDNGLKQADSDKSGGIMNQPLGSLAKTRKNSFEMVKRVRSARKRMPIVLDIIIAILLAAMICALAVGGFYAFRHFTVDYDTVEVEYTVVIDEKIAVNLKNDQVYCDVDGNTLHFGKIKSMSVDDNGRQIIVIAQTVKYKPDMGYSIGNERLAVGCEYILRTERGKILSGTVVEFVDKSISNNEKGGR